MLHFCSSPPVHELVIMTLRKGSLVELIFLDSFQRVLLYFVVNLFSQVIFVFLLFLGMVMSANEVETKEKYKNVVR